MVSVEPKLQGRLIGTTMMKELLRKVYFVTYTFSKLIYDICCYFQHGHRKIKLGTEEAHALRMYQRVGFKLLRKGHRALSLFCEYLLFSNSFL